MFGITFRTRNGAFPFHRFAISSPATTYLADEVLLGGRLCPGQRGDVLLLLLLLLFVVHLLLLLQQLLVLVLLLLQEVQVLLLLLEQQLLVLLLLVLLLAGPTGRQVAEPGRVRLLDEARRPTLRGERAAAQRRVSGGESRVE